MIKCDLFIEIKDEFTSSTNLGKLLGYSSKHVVIKIPCLSKILRIARPLVFLAPFLGLHQLSSISLRINQKHSLTTINNDEDNNNNILSQRKLSTAISAFE